MTSHAQARQILLSVWPRGVPRTLPLLQLTQANALLESGYGQGWGDLCAGSNNWGAVQSHDAPPCVPGSSCLYTDRHADGTTYQWCYRVYPTPEAGAHDFLRTMLKGNVVRAAASGNAMATSAAMHANKYFEGVGTPAQVIAARAKSTYEKSKAIAHVLGEPLMVALDHATVSSLSSYIGWGLLSAALAAGATHLAFRR